MAGADTASERDATSAMWHLLRDGRLLASHPDRRLCVVEAFERGLVGRVASRDFEDEAARPALVLWPGVEIVRA